MAFGNIFAASDVGVGGATASGNVGADLAFGPPSTAGQGGRHPLHPAHSFGLAFWLGVGALVLLVSVRHSLPA